MVDRSNSERLRGFCNGLTDRRTFAILESLSRLKIAQVTNHPAHIRSKFSTALIPYCEFCGNMPVMGEENDQFDVPVCNSFRPKIIGDQLCYTVDPNEYKDKVNLEGDISLTLFIHYNEDRQMEDGSGEDEHEEIIINTIGIIKKKNKAVMPAILLVLT